MTQKKKRGAPVRLEPHEIRNKRINVVLSQETLEGLKDLSALNNESVNGTINNLIINEIERNQDRLEKYREFMKDL